MRLNIIIAGLAAILLTACSKDILTVDAPVVDNKKPLTIEITDEFIESSTRANYNSFPSTTFETGDAIGVYAFDGSSYVISNKRYVKQSDGSWATDEDIPHDDGYTYYAYFPYRATTYTPSTSGTVDDIDTKFALFINDASNYFWQANQSTKANFTASNLMVSKGVITDTSSDGTTIKFTMHHKRGIAVFSGEAASQVFTVNIPYTVGSEKYFLMKPDVSTTVGGYTLSAKAGTFTKPEITEEKGTYLTFTALESGTFTLTIPASVDASLLYSVSYSVDNGATWVTTFNTSSEVVITTPTITAGNKVLWKGKGYQYAKSTGASSTFSSTCNFKASGNIMSLIYRDDFNNQKYLYTNYSFTSLFENCSKLINAHEMVLPANNLPSYCYYSMFRGCSNLTTVPELPATKLASWCYGYMFSDCTGLTTAQSILPATTLADYCCNSMFFNCSSLTTAPELPATTLASQCYASMFSGCTSLTTAPELPATTLENQCYSYMFYNCSNLNYIKAAFTTHNTSLTSNWVSGVSSSGTFYKNSAATWNTTGIHGVPSGWTVVTYTP